MATDDDAFGTTTGALAALVEEPSAVSLLPAGTLLGERFRLVGRIGAGGMGVVYRARDEKLSRDVAIKVHARQSGAERLEREATAMAQLSHPNVVTVHEAGVHEGAIFIAMELVEGETAQKWRARERRSWREVVRLYLAAGEGLLAIHDARLIHRDFKPENLLVGSDGRVRVADLGLARAVGGGPPRQGLEGTMTTGMAGTPAYMAPEQRTGGVVDARSDQWSFATALAEALRGLSPPSRVRKALARATATDPAARWPSLRPLLTELAYDPWPRRFTAVAVVLVAAGAFGLLRLSRHNDLCAVPPAEVASMWQAGRAAVEQAFIASRAPFAAASFARIDAALTRRAASWLAERRDACEATRVRRDQSEELLDRRRLCLDARRAETNDLVAVLAHGDARVVEKALGAIEGLPDVGRCGDLRALAARVPPPPPALAPRVAAIQSLVGQALALRRAGQDQAGLALLEPVSAEAAALGYAPLAAQMQAALGELQAGTGKAEPAAASLTRAYYDARRLGDDELSARTASYLVQVVGADLMQFDKAATWIELANAEIGRSAKHTRDQALLYIRIARVEKFAGHFDLAAGHLHDARTLLDALGESESVVYAEELLDEGMNLGDRGQNEKALETLLQQRALVERLYGPDHPALIQSLTRIGMKRSALGQEEEGIATLRQAAALADRTLPSNHPKSISAHANLGLAHFNHQDYAPAIAEWERLLPICEAELGKDHPNYAGVLDNLSLAYLDTDQPARALEGFRRVAAVEEKTLGPDHVDLALTLDHIGAALAMLHRCNEALAPLHRSLAIFDKGAPDAENRVHPLADLGFCLLELKRPAEAIAPLEAALKRLAQEKSRTEPVADARFKLANALWASGGDRRRAMTLAQQSKEGYASMGARGTRWIVDVDRWLRKHH